MAKAPEPVALARVSKIDDIVWPDRPEETFKIFMAMPEPMIDQLIDKFDAMALERGQFFAAEGVAAILIADERAARGCSRPKPPVRIALAIRQPRRRFVVTAEHYGRIARLLEQKQPLRLRVDFKATTSDRKSTAETSSARFRAARDGTRSS